jgi:hypothetical protein
VIRAEVKHRRLAQKIYGLICQQPHETMALRRESMGLFGRAKNQFGTVLKELQITLNIVRSNEPEIERDTWLPFQEINLEKENSINTCRRLDKAQAKPCQFWGFLPACFSLRCFFLLFIILTWGIFPIYMKFLSRNMMG